MSFELTETWKADFFSCKIVSSPDYQLINKSNEAHGPLKSASHYGCPKVTRERYTTHTKNQV